MSIVPFANFYKRLEYVAGYFSAAVSGFIGKLLNKELNNKIIDHLRWSLVCHIKNEDLLNMYPPWDDPERYFIDRIKKTKNGITITFHFIDIPGKAEAVLDLSTLKFHAFKLEPKQMRLFMEEDD